MLNSEVDLQSIKEHISFTSAT